MGKASAFWSRRSKLGKAGIIIAALFVIGVLVPTGDDKPAPTTTTQQVAAVATTVKATTTTTRAATTTTAPATTTTRATTTTTATALTGTATVADPKGDVRGQDGERLPAGEPVLDLVSVKLDSDGTTLRVRMDHASAVPTVTGSSPTGGDKYMLWSIEIKSAGEPLYALLINLIGDRWSQEVFDEASASMRGSGVPVVDGTLILASFPLSSLPRLQGPFEWAALTEYDVYFSDDWLDYITFGDVVPGSASSYSPLHQTYVPFPG